VGAAGGVTATTAEDRNAELVALGSRLGAAQATHRARRAFASAERREALDEAHMLRTAADVAEALGGMKGVLMKLGQMQSYLNDSLPPAWKAALATLQSDAPPMAPELAAEVVRAEFGSPPEEVFAEWDGVPIAAASVGQVHRAMTLDGRAVAVKVQYPGAADALTADLDNVGTFLKMAPKPEGQEDQPDIDLEPLLAEIRARVTEEADYRREAANQQLFADHFAGHPTIHVPKVVADRSGARVLTTELFDGVRFGDAEGWDQAERDLAGETIFRFVFGSVFRLGAYNGDPHPGNYLFRPGGEVCFLDFGLCRVVEPVVTEALGTLFRAAVVDADPEGFRASLEHAGFLRQGAPVDTDMVFDRVARPWQMLLSEQPAAMPFPVTDLAAPRTDDEKAMAAAFTLPPTFLLLTTRTLIGMQALLARLGSVQPWRSIAGEIWPFVDGPASTDMGRREEAWRADRRS